MRTYTYECAAFPQHSGGVVTWAVASLAADSSTGVQLVVTATQTITNDDYRAAAGGNLSAVGEAAAVTYVGQPVTKYYYFGSQRVAMRRGYAVYYLHGDHLGSTSLTTNATGDVVAQVRYLPYGQERWTSGAAQTDFTYTGQRAERGFGLSDYTARYYDPYLNRFISPDSIVPQPDDPQSLNRYSYVRNQPIRYSDPTGHKGDPGGGEGGGGVIIVVTPSEMEALAAWLSGQAAAAGAAASALVTQYVVAPAQTLVQQGDLAIQQIQQLAASFQSYADKGGGSSGGENSGSPDPNDPHSKETATRNNKAAEAANSPSNQRAIQWLEEDTQKVEHIMAQKHAWNRLVNLSGNAAEDYRAIQPYLEEVMSTEGKQINTSTLGPVMEFVKTINSQQIFVHAVQLSDGVLKVSDAWVATVTR